MKTALQKLMDSAQEKAAALLAAGGLWAGCFRCQGTHGHAEFEFEPVSAPADKRLLGDRIYFNVLSVNATETVVAMTRRVAVDLTRCPPDERELLAMMQGREVLVINGESGTARANRTLPILRGSEGRFVEFGKPWEKAFAKEPGQERQFVAGVELNETERFSALDQAGNLEMVAELKRKHLQKARQGRLR